MSGRPSRLRRVVRWTGPVALGVLVALVVHITVREPAHLGRAVDALRKHFESVPILRAALPGNPARGHANGSSGSRNGEKEGTGRNGHPRTGNGHAAAPGNSHGGNGHGNGNGHGGNGNGNGHPAEAGFSEITLEDPVAKILFLTERMEEARAVAEQETRRAEEARRRAAALFRRAQAASAGNGHGNGDHRSPGPVATGDVPLPVRASGDLAAGRAEEPTGGARLAAGASPPAPGAERAVRARAGRAGRGRGGRPVSSPPGIVPPPPSTTSSVTIGEPVRDLPPTPGLLASASRPTGPVPPPSSTRLAAAQSSGRSGRIPPPPSIPDEGDEEEDEEGDTLIGPERAPMLEPQRLHRVGGVLLPPGRLRLEPSFTYLQTDRFRIVVRGLDVLDVLFVGNIHSQDVRRESLISSLTFRYGLSDSWNIRGTIPYEWRSSDQSEAGINENVIPLTAKNRTERHSGLGDLSLGLSYQLYRSDSRLPNLVANFNYGLDTASDENIGRGTERLSGGLTFMTQSDPAVLFGSLNYTHDMHDVEGIRRGDLLGGSLGYSYALNYDLSLSTSVNFVRQIQETEIQTLRPDDPQLRLLERQLLIGTLNLGVTYALTARRSLDVSVGFGLTDDAPEFSLSMSVPMVFDTSGWW